MSERVYRAQQPQATEQIQIESSTQATQADKRRCSYYATQAVDEAVSRIRKQFGFATDSDVVNLAILALDGSAGIQVKMPAGKVEKLARQVKADTAAHSEQVAQRRRSGQARRRQQE